MDPFTLSIVSGLIVAVITGSAGYAVRGRIYKAKIKGAPSHYAERLGRMIEKAYAEGESRAIINAQAIVAIRDDMRVSLVSISQLLNSEITKLRSILYDDYEMQAAEDTLNLFFKTKGKAIEKADATRLYQQIQVLHTTWPEKREIIEVQVRKLLAELGLEANGKDFNSPFRGQSRSGEKV